MLVPSQTAVQGGHGFGDPGGELARWGLGRDTKWRSSCSKRACFRLFLVVFIRLILATQKFILGKSAKITKNKVSQYLMRF